MAAKLIMVGMPTMELMMPYKMPLPRELDDAFWSPSPFPDRSGGSARARGHMSGLATPCLGTVVITSFSAAVAGSRAKCAQQQANPDMTETRCVQRVGQCKAIREFVVTHEDRRHICARADKLQMRCSPLWKVHDQSTWRGWRCYESGMALCCDRVDALATRHCQRPRSVSLL